MSACMSVVFPAPAIPSTMHPTALFAGVDGVDVDEAAEPWSAGEVQVERRCLIKMMIYEVQCYIDTASIGSTFFRCLCFISMDSLLLSRQSFLSGSSCCPSMSLGFISVMTLPFLHGVLVSFECLGVLLFCCKPHLENSLDHFKRTLLPHFH